jgi:hypothetical protein
MGFSVWDEEPMSPGQYSSRAALDLLRKAVKERTVVIASKAEAGRRELGMTRQEMEECLLLLSKDDCEAAYGAPSKNPEKPGVHYELRSTRYLGKDIYVKYRIEKNGPIELTSFSPWGSIR